MCGERNALPQCVTGTAGGIISAKQRCRDHWQRNRRRESKGLVAEPPKSPPSLFSSLLRRLFSQLRCQNFAFAWIILSATQDREPWKILRMLSRHFELGKQAEYWGEWNKSKGEGGSRPLPAFLHSSQPSTFCKTKETQVNFQVAFAASVSVIFSSRKEYFSARNMERERKSGKIWSARFATVRRSEVTPTRLTHRSSKETLATQAAQENAYTAD